MGACARDLFKRTIADRFDLDAWRAIPQPD